MPSTRLWPRRGLDRSNLHGLHLLPIVRIEGFSAASGRFVGYSFLLRKFCQAGIFAGQLVRNAVGDVLVHEGTRDVLQLRMRLSLVSDRLDEWLLEVNGIVDVGGCGRLVTRSGVPRGHLCRSY